MTESPGSDELHYRFALRRIYLHTVVLSVAGTMIAFLQGGTSVGMGFLLGASISAINFRWLHRLVDSIGPQPEGPGRKPRRVWAFFLAFRYLLFGAVGYAIVKGFKVNVMAALIGLFVAVAAVILELLYELIYVRA